MAAVAAARRLEQLAGLVRVAAMGQGLRRKAGGTSARSGTAEPVAHPFTDLPSVETDGQGSSQVGVLERLLVAQQGDVADLHRWTHRLMQIPCDRLFMQGVALVFVDGGGEQQINFSTAQCPIQRSGVAQCDQIQAIVPRCFSPVLGKGL